MSDLENLPWRALHTEHARFAICAPRARKYPADVTPFAGLADHSLDSLRQLAELMHPGETTYIIGSAPPVVPGLIRGEPVPTLQMIPPDQIAPDDDESSVVPLSRQDAPAMVELTDLAFPGFFRPRTCEMGAYFGIRVGGELVAMGGERLAVPGYREISGVVTRPGHTGRGYAARLIERLLRTHAGAGLRSFLHVTCANTRAIALYRHLGFTVSGEVELHPLLRP